jgi:hypothetical protein
MQEMISYPCRFQEKIKNGETPPLTLEGRGNDMVVFVLVASDVSGVRSALQVFGVLCCKYQCRDALIFV